MADDNLSISGVISVDIEPAKKSLYQFDKLLLATVEHYQGTIDEIISQSKRLKQIDIKANVGDLGGLTDYINKLKELSHIKMGPSASLLRSVENLGKVADNVSSDNLQKFGQNLADMGSKVQQYSAALAPASTMMRQFATEVANLRSESASAIPVLTALKNVGDSLKAAKGQNKVRFDIDTKSLNDAQKTFAKFETDIAFRVKSLSKDFSILSTSMNQTGFRKITQDFGDMSKNLKKIDTQSLRIASDDARGLAIDVRALNTVMGLFGYSAFAQQIKGMAKGMIDATARTEDYKASLLAVTHDVDKASAMFKGFQDFSIKTPFELDEVMKAGVQLEAITSRMKGFKMTTMEAMDLASDMAMTFGKDLSTATETVGKVLAGSARGVEMLRNQFGVTRPALESWGVAMNKQGGVLMRSAGDIQNVVMAMRGIQKETSGMDALSLRENNLSTQLQAIHDMVTRLATALGDSILPVLKAVTQAFSAFLGMLTQLPGPVKAMAAITILLAGGLFMLTEKLAGLSIMVLAFVELQNKQKLNAAALIASNEAEGASQLKLASDYAATAAAAELAYQAKTKAAFASSAAGLTKDVMPEAEAALAANPAVLARFAKSKEMLEAPLIEGAIASGAAGDVFRKMGGFDPSRNKRIPLHSAIQDAERMAERRGPSKLAAALGQQGLAIGTGGALGLGQAGSHSFDDSKWIHRDSLAAKMEAEGIVPRTALGDKWGATNYRKWGEAEKSTTKLIGGGVLDVGEFAAEGATVKAASKIPFASMFSKLFAGFSGLFTQLGAFMTNMFIALSAPMGAMVLPIVGVIAGLGALAIGLKFLPEIIEKIRGVASSLTGHDFTGGATEYKKKIKEMTHSELTLDEQTGSLTFKDMLKNDSKWARTQADLKNYTWDKTPEELKQFDKAKTPEEIKKLNMKHITQRMIDYQGVADGLEKQDTRTAKEDELLREVKAAMQAVRANKNAMATGRIEDSPNYTSTEAMNVLREQKRKLDIGDRDGGYTNELGSFQAQSTIRADALKAYAEIIHKTSQLYGVDAEESKALEEQREKAMEAQAALLQKMHKEYIELVKVQIQGVHAGVSYVWAADKTLDLMKEMALVTDLTAEGDKQRLEYANKIKDAKLAELKEAHNIANLNKEVEESKQRYVTPKQTLEAAERKLKQAREEAHANDVKSHIGSTSRNLAFTMLPATERIKGEAVQLAQGQLNKEAKAMREAELIRRQAAIDAHDARGGMSAAPRRTLQLKDIPEVKINPKRLKELTKAWENQLNAGRWTSQQLTPVAHKHKDTPEELQAIANVNKARIAFNKAEMEKFLATTGKLTMDAASLQYYEAKKSFHEMQVLGLDAKKEEELRLNALRTMYREHYAALFKLAMEHEGNLAKLRKDAIGLEKGKLDLKSGVLDIVELSGEKTDKQRAVIARKREDIDGKEFFQKKLDIIRDYKTKRQDLEKQLQANEKLNTDFAIKERARQRKLLADYDKMEKSEIAAARQEAALSILGHEKEAQGYEKKDKKGDYDDRIAELELAKSRIEYKQAAVVTSTKSGEIGQPEGLRMLAKTYTDLFKAESLILDEKRKEVELTKNGREQQTEILKLKFEEFKLSQDTLQKYLDINAELRKQKKEKDDAEKKKKDDVLNSMPQVYGSYDEMMKAEEAKNKTEEAARTKKKEDEAEAAAKARDRRIFENDSGVEKARIRDRIYEQGLDLGKSIHKFGSNNYLENQEVQTTRKPEVDWSNYEFKKDGYLGHGLGKAGWVAKDPLKDMPIHGKPKTVPQKLLDEALDKKIQDTEKGVEHTIHLVLDVDKKKYKWDLPLTQTQKAGGGGSSSTAAGVNR